MTNLKQLPQLPKEYLIFVLMIGLIILKIMRIDSWTDMALGWVIGWLLGVKMEQARKKK